MAYKALRAEEKIGAMLPCNVIGQQCEDDYGDRRRGSRGVDGSDRRSAIGAIAGHVRGLRQQVVADIGW